jgi:hypothetical protein
MKKIALAFSVFVLTITICCSQDVVLKKSGEEISVKVLEIGNTEIIYKNFNNQEEPVFTMLKSEIFMISYKNGVKDIFTEDDTDAQPSYSDEELIMKGKQDAMMSYTAKNSGAGWTAATTVLLTPLIGVIPAAACSSSRPSAINLNGGDNQLMDYSSYNRAYIEQAHKIKKKKVGRSFGISSGAWLLIIFLL